jgi:hypothetical protein
LEENNSLLRSGRERYTYLDVNLRKKKEDSVFGSDKERGVDLGGEKH